MREIKINPRRIKKTDIKLIVDFLRKGKIIVYPTDTVYGLGCLATNKKAIGRIYRLKRRTKKKPLLVLIAGFKMLKRFFLVDKKQESFLRKIWPAKISVILNKKSALPEALTNGLSSAAVRLPKSKFLTKIIAAVGAPIVSTSLNLSGRKPLASANNLNNYFKKIKPDLIVNAGPLTGRPSRLIDLRDVCQPIILRK
ncbi:MAG TPA: L-threonylcarbamoyladenylate synthase [Candidatus Methylomirabilis sp.]|nr:L-threonylcarbamoyladenylate synthase [Candidatus Methylomirabilis sp.]